MATLTDAKMEQLLAPYLFSPLTYAEGASTSLAVVEIAPTAAQSLYGSISLYLDLLLKWNGRTNLTAVRDPEQIVTRHFGESLFAARCATLLLPNAGWALDFGSGAGFPGVPLQLYVPGLRVTLAESQSKKAAFLRTVVRELGLSTEIWGGRVNDMASGTEFDLVTMRAVDDPARARAEAWGRVRAGCWLLEMTAGLRMGRGLEGEVEIRIPGTRDGLIVMSRKTLNEE